ncbi:hypothetical protein [Nocardioides jishulii]|uniref:hypothetical protein n=1 Tax=Nocardioides jishulii TaxID=2575440 RepID=UPI0014854AA9|nr:hypothetical protein [Nocardioides jishulii]
MELPLGWYEPEMKKIMRNIALAGAAKKVYDEARKPHNQAKIKSVIDQVKNRRNQKRR